MLAMNKQAQDLEETKGALKVSLMNQKETNQAEWQKDENWGGPKWAIVSIIIFELN